MIERQEAKKAEFIQKLGQLQTRLDDALSGRAQLQEKVANLEASLEDGQRAMNEKDGKITRLQQQVEMLEVTVETLQERAAEAGLSGAASVEHTGQSLKLRRSRQIKGNRLDTDELGASKAGSQSHQFETGSAESAERKSKANRRNGQADDSQDSARDKKRSRSATSKASGTQRKRGSGDNGLERASPGSGAQSESGSRRNNSQGDVVTAKDEKDGQKGGAAKARIQRAP